MSKQNEILVTIEEFLKDRKGPDFQVSLESDLRKDLQADSVELMEFIINLEDEYQIEIPDKAIDEFNTVGDVVDYIEKRTAITDEKGIVQRLFWMIFFSVLFIRILLILYGILLKIHFVCDRMKVIKYERRTKS